jgi:hypothetical protein
MILLFFSLIALNSPAEVLLTGQTVSAFVDVSASNDINNGFDSQDERLDTPFTTFSQSLTAATSSGGIAGAQWNGEITLAVAEDTITATGDLNLDAQTISDGALGGGRCANASATSRAGLELIIEVTESPVAVTFGYTGTHTTTGVTGGCGGSGTAELFRVSIVNLATSEVIDTGDSGVFCTSRVDLPSVCGEVTRDFSRNLPPATYSISVSMEAGSGRIGTANATGNWTLEIGPPPACDLTWNEFGAGGLFSDEDNWSPKQAPTDDGAGCSNLLVERNGAFTIGVSGLQSANSLTLRSGAPTLQSVTGGVLRLSRAVNPQGFGGLEAGEGAVVTVDGVKIDTNGVILGTGGTGETRLTVQGAESRIRSLGLTPTDTDDKSIEVGNLSDAVLEVTNGASIEAGRIEIGLSPAGNAAIKGTAFIRGAAGSQPSTIAATEEVHVGRVGEGVLRVQDGALLQTREFANVFVGGVGNGEFSVAGANPANSASPARAEIDGELIVGGSQAVTSTAIVGGGGRLTATGVRLGEEGPATLFIQDGGRVELTDSLRIDPEHNSLLEVANGGVLLVGSSLNIGLGVGTGARARVIGAAGGALSQLTGVTLRVGGQFGTGVLELSGQANVEATNLFVPRVAEDSSTGNGTVRIEDGAIASFSQDVLIGDQGPGLVQVSGPSTLNAGIAVEIGADGKLEVAALGTVISPRVRVIASGGRVIGIRERGKQGTAAPGRIEGDLELGDGAILSLEANGDGGPALEVTGNLTAAGELEVIFPADAAIDAGDLFGLLDVAGNASGAFDSVTSPSRTDDFEATASFDNGELVIQVVAPGAPVNGGEGEGEGEGEEEGEGEGEGEPQPPMGCGGGSGAKLLPWTQQLTDLVTYLFSITLLFSAGMLYKRRTA